MQLTLEARVALIEAAVFEVLRVLAPAEAAPHIAGRLGVGMDIQALAARLGQPLHDNGGEP